MDGENFMENPMNKWMIWGVFTPPPLFLECHPYITFPTLPNLAKATPEPGDGTLRLVYHHILCHHWAINVGSMEKWHIYLHECWIFMVFM